MATTLANLRAKLNGEIGVVTDGEASPWSTTVRNNAISDGYAELWRQGVWKPVTEDLAASSTAYTYPLTASLMRKLRRVDLIDSSGYTCGTAAGRIEDDGLGGYQLVLPTPVADGYTLRVWGWTAYKSQFASDYDSDDLAAEYNRIPLLKAKAICYRQQMAMFARYGEHQAIPPEMNLTVDQVIALVTAAEREFIDSCRSLSGHRVRVGHPR